MSRITRAALAFTILAGALLPLASTVPASAQPVPVRVMTLNVLYGGDELDLDTGGWCTKPRGCHAALRQIVRTIEAASPDVVGLQEPINNTRWIADRLGWYASPRNHVISRFPIVDPPAGRGVYVFVELAPGEVVAVANTHLTSTPYSPYMIRNGQPRERILAVEERYRLPEVRKHLRILPRLAARGIPVFFTGDFNSPSHHDYTRAYVDARGLPYRVAWPVSTALADVGFRDSYREAHPDPVARPGFTWTPGVPRLRVHEVHDRIDWVLAAGPSSTVSSQIVGEPGGADVDIEVDPYVTDHRGVVSEFALTPGVPPRFVAPAERRVFRGDDLAVRFHADGRVGERIAIVRAGERPSEVLRSRSTGGAADGEVTFADVGLSSGAYDVLLLSPNGAPRATARFWLYRADEPVRVWTRDRVYEQGERIRVSWSGAPGNRYDWLGIFRPTDIHPLADVCDAGYCRNWNYKWYRYTGARIQGTATFGPNAEIGYGTWPLTRGRYEIRLLADDGYRLLAVSNTFRVVARR
ncbi:MAG TPA: endonuclease/exonuclease/phosphatase family protein [Actinomycetota bacterium]|nr:endonuclease/exonuclease/phosphatase family protein [Actinomycetota bacterium]